MAERSGGCLCGAVRFTARAVPGHAGICHCPMCRRWTGSAFIEVDVPEGDVTWHGAEHISVYTSSGWGERAFCSRCGTHLYFRMTVENEFSGKYAIPMGLFDDPEGFEVGYEIYIDHKPGSFAFEDKGQMRLTRDDCVARFPLLDSGPT